MAAVASRRVDATLAVLATTALAAIMLVAAPHSAVPVHAAEGDGPDAMPETTAAGEKFKGPAPSMPHLSFEDFGTAINGSHTHLMFLYLDDLPAWEHFVETANDVAAKLVFNANEADSAARKMQAKADRAARRSTMAFQIKGRAHKKEAKLEEAHLKMLSFEEHKDTKTRVPVWMSDVRASPQYKSHFALRKFPTILLFPRGVSKFYREIPFAYNMTADDILLAVRKMQLITSATPRELEDSLLRMESWFVDGGTMEQAEQDMREAIKRADEHVARVKARGKTADKCRNALRTLRTRRASHPDDIALVEGKARWACEQAVEIPAFGNIRKLLEESLALPADEYSSDEAGSGEGGGDVGEGDAAIQPRMPMWEEAIREAERLAVIEQDMGKLELSVVNTWVNVIAEAKKANLASVSFVAREANSVRRQLYAGNTFLTDESTADLLSRANVLNELVSHVLERDATLGVNEGDNAVEGTDAEL